MNSLLVVLKLTQVLLATSTIIRSNTLAIIRILTIFHLIHQITHRKCMILRCAKDDGFLALIYFIQYNTNSFRFTLFNNNYFIEIGFFVKCALLHFTLNDLIIRGINIIIEGRFDAPYFKWREKSIIHAFLE